MEEKRGFKPSVSLVAGLILVTGNKGLCFEDIQDTLKMSKGAVSLALNLLMGLGKLEDFKKFNERKRYFRIPANLSLKDHIETAKEMFIEFRELMSQLLDDEQIVFEEEFEKMMREDLEFVSFVSQKVTDAVEEWKKEKYEKN